MVEQQHTLLARLWTTRTSCGSFRVQLIHDHGISLVQRRAERQQVLHLEGRQVLVEETTQRLEIRGVGDRLAVESTHYGERGAGDPNGFGDRFHVEPVLPVPTSIVSLHQLLDSKPNHIYDLQQAIENERVGVDNSLGPATIMLSSTTVGENNKLATTTPI